MGRERRRTRSVNCRAIIYSRRSSDVPAKATTGGRWKGWWAKRSGTSWCRVRDSPPDLPESRLLRSDFEYRSFDIPPPGSWRGACVGASSPSPCRPPIRCPSRSASASPLSIKCQIESRLVHLKDSGLHGTRRGENQSSQRRSTCGPMHVACGPASHGAGSPRQPSLGETTYLDSIEIGGGGGSCAPPPYCKQATC
jgi:hypothetical protein